MRFHTYGDPAMPPIMLIHGGGNAWWNYLRQARALAERYYVILPTLDGHGEEAATPYVSTEKTADELLDYIDTHCSGHLFALGGVSLGGQIVIELLSRRADVARNSRGWLVSASRLSGCSAGGCSAKKPAAGSWP